MTVNYCAACIKKHKHADIGFVDCTCICHKVKWIGEDSEC